MAADTQSDTVKRKLVFLAGFSLYFAALWLLWETPVVYPLKIFVVMLHEISHGIASIATGGAIDKIVLDPYQGGACYCGGGNAFLTLSAGYSGELACWPPRTAGASPPRHWSSASARSWWFSRRSMSATASDWPSDWPSAPR